MILRAPSPRRRRARPLADLALLGHVPSRRLAGLVAVALAPAIFGACRSPGPYGFAMRYAPTADEERAVASAKEYDPVMVQRFPEQWRRQPTSVFGVVTGRASGAGGAAYLTLSVRRLEPRNLCQYANDEDTCRVTVSDRDFGVLHALLPLRPDDDVGATAVGVGTLVRAVGAFADDTDPGDGGPILRGTWYRQWPPSTYVTRASAGEMRQ